jgi:predicted DNA-binding protein (MmcQ/YjbR family)
MAMSPFKKAETELLKFALGYPETHEDRPWGERVVKVRKKVFVFFHVPSDGLHVTVKLPSSASMALGLPFVTPTGYGLGKSGWVTATFGAKQRPNLPMLRQWIDESFRAIAPCKLHPPQGAPPEAARAKAVGKGSGKARRRAPAK